MFSFDNSSKTFYVSTVDPSDEGTYVVLLTGILAIGEASSTLSFQVQIINPCREANFSSSNAMING